ncbi:MAG: ion transporter [Planctomycetes bacterium]|nr:ion transporter [Planctomycetota bacterium]
MEMREQLREAHDRATSGSLLRIVSRLLNEPVMGFLALVALGTALGPMVFEFGDRTDLMLRVIEWVVVGVFAAEFVVQYLLAEDRKSWLWSAWRIVDVAAILGPVVALLPQVSDAFRGSLVLRLLRVGRAVAFGARAGSAAVRGQRHSGRTARFVQPPVSVVRPGGGTPAVAAWSDFIAWTRQPDTAWFHAAGVSADGFRELAVTSGIAAQAFAEMLTGRPAARIVSAENYTALLLPMPTVVDRGDSPAVNHGWLLAFLSREGVLTALDGDLDIQEAVLPVLAGAGVPEFTFPVRVASALLLVAHDRFGVAHERFEEAVRELEAIPLDEGGPAFLGQATRLRREISATAVNLWKLKALLDRIDARRESFQGAVLTENEFLPKLFAKVEESHRSFGELKDELTDLMELHINLTSFQMNKFLKLLAVVSFLGLFPSVIGGLLGMNVDGNPWPVTLGQVAFFILMGMATSLYAFAVKGWLK